MRLPILRLRSRALMPIAGLLVLAGCSSSNPFSPASCEAVAGFYTFTRYDFTPTATAIQPANVLERFVPASTSVELFSGCDVLLRYRLQGGTSALLSGRMDASPDRVIIQFVDPQNRLPQLLLRSPVTFQRRGADELFLEGVTSVNLAAYDPQAYAGLTDVQGTLRITLRRVAPPDA